MCSELFTYVQKPLQTARLNGNCTQVNFPVLPCIGVLLVYQHAAIDIVGQKVERAGKKRSQHGSWLYNFFGPQ